MLASAAVMDTRLLDLCSTKQANARVLQGTTPAFCALLAADVARHTPGRRVLVITPGEEEARRLADDARFFYGKDGTDAPVLLVPAHDNHPYADLSSDASASAGRLAALFQLTRADLSPAIVVCSAQSLARRVMPADELAALSSRIATGEELDRDAFVRRLIAAGYLRTPLVADPGTFSVRGGVIDIFPSLCPFPIRIDLFGDTIESLRTFDPDTQRTLREIADVWVHPVRETVTTGRADPIARIREAADLAKYPSSETRKLIEHIRNNDEFVGIETLTPAFHERMVPLWDYAAGSQTLWLVVDPDGVRAVLENEADLAQQRYRDRLEERRLAFPPEEHYVSAPDFDAALGAADRVLAPRLERLEHADEGAATRVDIDDNQTLRFELERARRVKADELLGPLANALREWHQTGFSITVVCESDSRRQKLAALLREYDVDERTANLVQGTLSAGFVLKGEKRVFLTDREIFGERRAAPQKQSAAARRAKEALLGNVSDFSELAAGDYLVHQLHGVGLYKGLTKLPQTGLPLDFLHLEYLGGILYLPVYRLGEVQRYIGAEGHKPRLDKLGGLTWDKEKRKVKTEVQALAEELLKLYAQRASLPGQAFPPPDAMFREFEATFEFEETPDQLAAIEAVMKDMEASHPMDRLVCGDVGYGKTEVALRAVLKAVLGGQQAALLAPTTVLVEQHYQTMKRRFAGWPIKIARLSRFQSAREQTETVKGLADGSIDAVVGTHRLLSRDVRFDKLGLLVIDEEQRFGVAHKERLKKVRTQIDVLTLTATPIPRTLHLAMTGLRDLSIIATPPADRRAIRTFIARPDEGVLREGIRRELARNGQIFFVTPRIIDARSPDDKSLEEWAETIRTVVPEARVATAHGQMAPAELEKVMIDFVDGKYDVLVSTTIVESGLDIPRANTMFVARADRFGLAQLYQLRGRIGRSKERAFCYLLVPPPKTMTKDAERRLETLQRFTELGAGFMIASHDLEIRGAGELLGAKQSGSIAAVGFDAYTRMLEEAVAELRGEEIVFHRDPELHVDMPGFIPDDYVPDTGQRLDLYKRLSRAEDADEVAAILEEIADRYGTPPDDVARLGELMVLLTLARRLRAQSVEVSSSRLILALPADTPLDADALATLMSQPGSAYRFTPDRRLAFAFDAEARKQPLRAAQRALLELLDCVT